MCKSHVKESHDTQKVITCEVLHITLTCTTSSCSQKLIKTNIRLANLTDSHSVSCSKPQPVDRTSE